MLPFDSLFKNRFRYVFKRLTTSLSIITSLIWLIAFTFKLRAICFHLIFVSKLREAIIINLRFLANAIFNCIGMRVFALSSTLIKTLLRQLYFEFVFNKSRCWSSWRIKPFFYLLFNDIFLNMNISLILLTVMWWFIVF